MPLVRNKSDVIPQEDPRAEPFFTAEQLNALQAVNAGNASSHQQKIAVEYIVHTLCGTYDISYRPDKEHDTFVAEGKRIAGVRLVGLFKLAIRRQSRGESAAPTQG